MLRASPPLSKLEVHTLTYAPGYDPSICERDSNGNDAVLYLNHLDVLVLDSIPLDCQVFASLCCPYVLKLELKDVRPNGPDAEVAAPEWDVSKNSSQGMTGADCKFSRSAASTTGLEGHVLIWSRWPRDG